MTRVTSHPANDANGEWMPDGKSVVFASARDGALNIRRKAADGTGTAARLSESPNDQRPLSVIPDGTRLLFHDISPESSDFAVMTLDGESTIETLLDTDFGLENAHHSPNGDWLAYESNDSGTYEVYVRRFSDIDRRWQISNGGGIHPLWGPDGTELFYRSRQGHLLRVEIETEPEFRAGNPETVLDPGSYYIQPYERPFDISPDGQKFLMIKEGDVARDNPFGGLTQLIVVQNWFEELKARVPAGERRCPTKIGGECQTPVQTEPVGRRRLASDVG